MYKEDISATYNISDIEIEYPPPIYARDTKNKAEELGRLHAAMYLTDCNGCMLFTVCI